MSDSTSDPNGEAETAASKSGPASYTPTLDPLAAPSDSPPSDPAAPPIASARRRGLLGLIDQIVENSRRRRTSSREVAQVLRALRSPLLVSLIGVIAFAVPGQTLEIYELYAEEIDLSAGFVGQNLRFVIFFVMLYFTGYVLWYIARVLTLGDDVAFEALKEDDAAGFVAKWAPRVAGAAPALAAGAGMVTAAAGMEVGADGEGASARSGLFGAAVIAALIGAARLWLSWRRSRRPDGSRDYAAGTGFLLRLEVRFALGAMLIGVMIALMFNPIGFIQFVGSLSLLCLFMMALVFVTAQLTWTNDRYAVPALTIVLLAAITFSAFDWNDNHYIRLLKDQRAAAESAPAAAGGETAAPRRDAQAELRRRTDSTLQAFQAWYQSRADRHLYEAAGVRYPVYVVAAQGGGLYAAYQSAMFLSRMQDACPSFAQHVFALSGVSGGAVGTTLFAALAKRFVEEQHVMGPDDSCLDSLAQGRFSLEEGFPEESLQAKTHAMLRQDFLSPVLSAMLFGDFVARFLPFPIPALDRSRALEKAFETAWDRIDPEGENVLRSGVLDYWDPTGVAPALLINTTEVETGRRLVISPIQRLAPGVRSYAEEVYRAPGEAPPDMRLSSAMVTSARFPYVTPAGSIDLFSPGGGERGEALPRKTRLVDGGYFENSGLATAMDLKEAVEREARRQLRLNQKSANVDLRVIVFDLTEDKYVDPPYGLGELLSPVRAILSARGERARLEQRRARASLNASCRYTVVEDVESLEGETCGVDRSRNNRVWSVSLNDRDYDFQLGWILSSDTLSLISQLLGDPRRCDPRAGYGAGRAVNLPSDPVAAYDTLAQETAAEQDAVRGHNSCVGAFIVEQLSIAARGAAKAAEPPAPAPAPTPEPRFQTPPVSEIPVPAAPAQ